jgi:hypothetical protein
MCNQQHTTQLITPIVYFGQEERIFPYETACISHGLYSQLRSRLQHPEKVYITWEPPKRGSFIGLVALFGPTPPPISEAPLPTFTKGQAPELVT